MAKLFKEEQRFHDLVTISGLIVIGLLILYGMLKPFIQGASGFPFLKAAIFLILVVVAVVLIRKVRMDFSISGKKIRIKVSPFRSNVVEIGKKEVEDITFFKINEAMISSGFTVHFGDRTKNYYMGDRAGIVIRLKDGKNKIIFSDEIYLDRVRIMKLLRDNGWNIAGEADATASS